MKILCKQSENFVEGAVINYNVILSCKLWLIILYAIWFQCSFHFYMIHLCYMHRVIIGGNLVKLSTEYGMQKTRLISLDCHLPYLTILLSVKNTDLKKLVRVRVIFIICLKLIIVDIKYHSIDFSYYIQNYYLSLINYGGGWGLGVNSALNELSNGYTYRMVIHIEW